MDAIYTYDDYSKDSRPRLQFPARTGRQTTYAQWLAYNYRLHHDDDLPPAAENRPLAPTIVNHGRWLWLCPACLTALQVSETAGAVDPCCCPACFTQGFVQPAFPADRAAIEAELMRQPGYRWNAPFRNWEPGWSLEYLRERTDRAQAQLDAGATYVRAASIGTPRTWSVGEVLTAANMNTYIREIQRDLIGTNGPIEFRNALVAASLTTAERNALTAQAGMLLYNSTLNRVEQYEDSAWHSTLRHHISQLTAAAVAPITVTHNLGVKPIIFQMMIERVKDTELYGYSLGDRCVIPQAEHTSAPFWGVYDVTETQYKAKAIGTPGFLPNQRSFVIHKINEGSVFVDLDNNPNSTDSNGGWGARFVAIG